MINIPDFTQGDSVNWETDLPKEYQDGWALQWAIRGENQLDLTATQMLPETTFSTVITTTQSSGLTSGRYDWVAVVTKGFERVTLANGTLNVSSDLFSVTVPYDSRSQAEKHLDLVNQAISTITSNAAARYKIDDREYDYQSLGDLIKWRDQLRIQVQREQALQKVQQGFGDSRVLRSRFGWS